MTKGRPSRAAAHRTRSRCSLRTPALSDLDLRILDLLASHRVLTQTQLASINPETPARTLRYRCARLTREGLAGRSRPYRERGSAPHHFWPTRKGEAIVTGGPPPRGGERREPNPLFLAHAAGLSEVYVALATTLPAGATLTRFEREANAREPFTAWASREKRAIAPDAFIEITEVDGGSLLAFVELDMGSMSHRRLKTKAAGYAEYVKVEAWRERHGFCPALLFLTTVGKRARSFLAAMEKEAGRDSLLLTCSCDLARNLPRLASENRWLLSVDEGKQAVDLLTALCEARRPFDEEQERAKAERDREDAERQRLRSDPYALRTHLRSRTHCDLGIERLGLPAAALTFTLEHDDPLEEAEREALKALGAMLADPLRVQLDDREVTEEEPRLRRTRPPPPGPPARSGQRPRRALRRRPGAAQGAQAPPGRNAPRPQRPELAAPRRSQTRRRCPRQARAPARGLPRRARTKGTAPRQGPRDCQPPSQPTGGFSRGGRPPFVATMPELRGGRVSRSRVGALRARRPP